MENYLIYILMALVLVKIASPTSIEVGVILSNGSSTYNYTVNTNITGSELVDTINITEAYIYFDNIEYCAWGYKGWLTTERACAVLPVDPGAGGGSQSGGAYQPSLAENCQNMGGTWDPDRGCIFPENATINQTIFQEQLEPSNPYLQLIKFAALFSMGLWLFMYLVKEDEEVKENAEKNRES